MAQVSQTCPVDLEDGLARAGDDREFFKELLEIFLEDVPLRMDEIQAGLAASDAPAVSRAAHGIKGAAANLSANPIREAAFQIEQGARAGDLAGLDEAAKTLQLEIERLAAYAANF